MCDTVQRHRKNGTHNGQLSIYNNCVSLPVLQCWSSCLHCRIYVWCKQGKSCLRPAADMTRVGGPLFFSGVSGCLHNTFLYKLAPNFLTMTIEHPSAMCRYVRLFCSRPFLIPRNIKITHKFHPVGIIFFICPMHNDNMDNMSLVYDALGAPLFKAKDRHV